MKTLVAASKNKGKIREIKEILGGIYNIISMEDAGVDLEIEETGTTFEQNALIKAKTVYKLTGLPSLADDSGIVVEALDGRPGIYSARFSANEYTGYTEAGDTTADKDGEKKPESIDKSNNRKLLKEMAGKTDRRAKFVSAVVLFNNEENYLVGYGEAHGEVLHKEDGSNGFGYDPLFYSYDLKKSFGEASAEEKNKISHRYRALKDLFSKL